VLEAWEVLLVPPLEEEDEVAVIRGIGPGRPAGISSVVGRKLVIF
jgi:hypothetical protein